MPRGVCELACPSDGFAPSSTHHEKESHMATGIEINLSELIRDLDSLSDEAPTEN